MFSSESEAPVSKGDRTRAHVRAIALRSFRERGYDATTIRQIAQEAGVSVGTTNYHFASKNQLVQELYVDVQERHRDVALPGVESTTDLIERLDIVFGAGLDVLAPYHEHAAEFVSAALAPKSEINPLSSESSTARGLTEQIFSAAVSGASPALPADIARGLAPALFLAHLLIALYWVYDSSPDQAKTRRLVERGLGLLKLVLPLVRLPLLRKPIAEVLSLIGDIRT